MDIKALSIQVQAKGVQQAANALGNLAKNAAQLDPVLTRAKAGLDTISKISLGSTNAQVKGTAESIQYLRNSTKEFSNIGQGFKGLSNSLTSVATSIEKLVTSTQGLATFNTQLQQLKNTLSEMKGMSTVLTGIGTSAANASSRQAGGGGGSRYPADEAEKYAKVQQRLIANIEREAVITSQGKIAWLEMQAARRGVSEQAAPFIAQLKAQSAVMGNATMGTRQYNAALRMVPAQFTDIATQLAGGQNPMLILMQQGGQMKDMFGSVGAAAKAAGTYIKSLFLNPLVLTAAALAGFTYALYNSSKQTEELNKALVLSGGYLGKTSDQVRVLSQQMSGVDGTSASVVEAFQALASSGKITGDNVERLARTTANFSRAAGTDIEKVVAEYASLSKKPAEALVSLNEKYHFLTASVYEQVRALEAQGKTLQATQVAQDALANSQDEMTRKMKANAGIITKAFQGVSDMFTNIFHAVDNLGKEDNLRDFVNSVRELKSAEDNLAMARAQGNKYLENQYAKDVAAAKASVKSVGDRMVAKNAEATAEKTANEQRESSLSNQRALEELLAKSKNKTMRLEEGRAKIEKEYAEAQERVNRGGEDGALAAKYIAAIPKAQALAALEESMRDKSATGGEDRLATLRAEQKALELNIAGVKSQGTEYEKLTEANKRLFAVQDLIAKGGDGKKLAVLRAEQSQLEINVGLEKQLAGATSEANMNADIIKSTQSIQSQTEALRDQYNEIVANGGGKARLTQLDKELAKTQEEMARATSLDTFMLLANKEATLQAAIAQDKKNKSEVKALQYKQDLAVVEAQGKSSLEAMIAQYNLERDSINMSNRERQTANQLLQIETQLNREINPLQVEVTRLRAAGTEESNKEADALQRVIDKKREVAGLQGAETARQGGQRAQLEGKDFSTDAKTGFDNYYDSLTKRQDMFQQFYANSTQLMTDSLETFFNTGKFDAKSFFADMMKMISKMIAQMLVLKAVKTAVGMYENGGTFDSSQGYNSTNGMTKYANGGTFTNSVVNRPTPFKFANGGGFSLGVMGEAGPEAVMPLTRGANGKLGVQATGSSGGTTNNVSVVVNVASDGSATTNTTSDASNAKKMGEAIKAAVLSVIVQEKRPGGMLSA